MAQLSQEAATDLIRVLKPAGEMEEEIRQLREALAAAQEQAR